MQLLRGAFCPGEGAEIVEYTRYKIDEKRRTLFERAYDKAGEALRSSSHCLGYELSHCTEARDYYTLRIEWDSEEGHLNRNGPEFKTFFVLVQPYVKDIEEMRHYEVISIGEKISVRVFAHLRMRLSRHANGNNSIYRQRQVSRTPD